MKTRTIIFCVLFIVFSKLHAQSNLTVYNNFGFIQENRQIELSAGTALYQIGELARNIETGSIYIKFEIDIPILEQHFNFDLFSIPQYVENFTGHKIEVCLNNDLYIEGIVDFIDANHILLSDETGRQTFIKRQNIQYIEFPPFEKIINTKPALNILVNSTSFRTVKYYLGYLFNGISWNAEYLGMYDEDKNLLELNSRAKIENKSGKSFSDAQLRLVSGEVSRRQMRGIPARAYAADRMLKVQAAPAPEMQQEKQYEYHVFSIDRKFTIKHNQSKQLTIYTPKSIKVNKRLIYDGRSNNDKVYAYIEFKNDKQTGIGLPLPEGVVKIFKKTADGSQLYIGEDRIPHSPENDLVKIVTGVSFDIKGERIQTAFRRISDRVREETYGITINNNSDKDEEIIITEYVFGDWEIITSSPEYKKVTSTEIQFTLTVPAKNNRKIDYTVRYRR